MMVSNSPLVVYTKLSPNCNKPRNHVIDTLSIHCMAGNPTIEVCGEIFQCTEPKKRASSQYGIGSDGRIALYVNECDRSWCTSSGPNDNRAVTIEVANDGGASTGWHVSDKAYESLIALCADICKRNGIVKLLWQADKSLIGQVDKQNMTVHRWFQNKACPGDYLYNLHGKIASEVNMRLEDDDMDKATFNKMFTEAMNDYRKSLRDNDSGGWSEEARNFMVKNKLMAGNGTTLDGQPNMMWEDLLTREQVSQLFYAFAKKLGVDVT